MTEGRRLALCAADMYASDGLCLTAATVLTEAFRREGGPGSSDPLLQDRTVEMVFFAAESGVGAVALLEALWESYPDWSLLPALSAHTAIHTRGPEAEQMGQAMLERLRDSPEHPLGLAVLAEYILLNDEPDQAQGYGRRALADEDTPPGSETTCANCCVSSLHATRLVSGR